MKKFQKTRSRDKARKRGRERIDRNGEKRCRKILSHPQMRFRSAFLFIYKFIYLVHNWPVSKTATADTQQFKSICIYDFWLSHCCFCCSFFPLSTFSHSLSLLMQIFIITIVSSSSVRVKVLHFKQLSAKYVVYWAVILSLLAHHTDLFFRTVHAYLLPLRPNKINVIVNYWDNVKMAWALCFLFFFFFKNTIGKITVKQAQA